MPDIAKGFSLWCREGYICEMPSENLLENSLAIENCVGGWVCSVSFFKLATDSNSCHLRLKFLGDSHLLGSNRL